MQYCNERNDSARERKCEQMQTVTTTPPKPRIKNFCGPKVHHISSLDGLRNSHLVVCGTPSQ